MDEELTAAFARLMVWSWCIALCVRAWAVIIWAVLS
jgi:hypothetical protein